MNLPSRGSCQCGSITYVLKNNPVTTYACHCRDCQKRTGSAFSLGMLIKADSIDIEGELSAWERSSDKGNINARYSCQNCGNIIYGVGSFTPEVFKLQPGTLENTSEVFPEVHLWTKRAQPWVSMPEGAPQFEEQPEDVSEILSAAISYRKSKNR